jgi:hypothetical protein
MEVSIEDASDEARVPLAQPRIRFQIPAARKTVRMHHQERPVRPTARELLNPSCRLTERAGVRDKAGAFLAWRKQHARDVANASVSHLAIRPADVDGHRCGAARASQILVECPQKRRGPLIRHSVEPANRFLRGIEGVEPMSHAVHDQDPAPAGGLVYRVRIPGNVPTEHGHADRAP